MTIRSLLVGVLLILGAPAGAGDKRAMHVSPPMAYDPVGAHDSALDGADSSSRIARE